MSTYDFLEDAVPSGVERAVVGPKTRKVEAVRRVERFEEGSPGLEVVPTVVPRVRKVESLDPEPLVMPSSPFEVGVVPRRFPGVGRSVSVPGGIPGSVTSPLPEPSVERLSEFLITLEDNDGGGFSLLTLHRLVKSKGCEPLAFYDEVVSLIPGGTYLVISTSNKIKHLLNLEWPEVRAAGPNRRAVPC